MLRQAGTWALGPFAAVRAPGQTSPQATEYKETTREYRIQRNEN